ncbi:MAG: DUF4405 domain-containing protein [Rhodospirillum sp.]|nr:DUF4405 domain-containing protein [Rhodospirillum sp.]MCF8489269.1 DUF4405 domain-containing protein [Rhodospirillum sp.]MCF8502724.1 DUF4405 domain-containing protein [Rhodospirillum sp.]
MSARAQTPQGDGPDPMAPVATSDNHAHARHHLLPPGISTPLTAALFLVIAVTGVMLFWEWSPSSVRIAHGWLGMFFLAAALWHLIRHWSGFSHSLLRGVTQVTIALALIGAGVLIALTAHEPGSGIGRHRTWSEAPPASSAPLPLPQHDQSVS